VVSHKGHLRANPFRAGQTRICRSSTSWRPMTAGECPLSVRHSATSRMVSSSWDAEQMTMNPAVFVHGLIGPFNDPDVFTALLPRDSSFVDLNGYGGSVGPMVTTESQTEALYNHISSTHPDRKVHLIAHSIGAVWAFTLAAQFPDLVASIVTVEGNFSLADAFWSSAIAALTADEAESTIRSTLSDTPAWLEAAGVVADAESMMRAETALAYQPWRTVWESARAVIGTSGSEEYEPMLRSVFDQVPVHLIAGERSSADWHVPEWARNAAATDTVIPSVGHMMMLEDPHRFCAALAAVLS
jgi:lipase